MGGDESVLPVSAQQRLTVQQAEGRWGAPKQKKLTLKQLSDFTLELAKDTQGLCFTPEQLTGEIARREAEAQQKLEEQLRKETEQQEAEAKAKADAEAAEQAKAEQEKKNQEAEQKAAEEKKAQEAKRKAEEEKQKKQEAERKKQEEEKKRQEEEERKQQEADNTTSTGSCTLTIECHTLLDNLDNVKESKQKYVPASGVILKKTKVPFTEGETVYDILKRTCKRLASSWRCPTPAATAATTWRASATCTSSTAVGSPAGCTASTAGSPTTAAAAVWCRRETTSCGATPALAWARTCSTGGLFPRGSSGNTGLNGAVFCIDLKKERKK